MSHKSKIALYWPGDARRKPNELAAPNVEEATQQIERAVRKLGRETYRIGGFIEKPHEAIEKLGPVQDPLIGVCVHWFYGPHTTDGVVGKDNPLLLASNFSGRWPGLVGLLNTGACLESLGRPFSRAWSGAADMSADEGFMDRLSEWLTTGAIRYPEDQVAYAAPVSPPALARARAVADEIRRRRVLVLMLGDTSMGMINGYFGPRLLNRHGFTEHKVDQAWIIDRGRRIDERRIDDALRFVEGRRASPSTGARAAPPTSTSARRASSSATTSPCSTWWASSRPTASAGSTSSASSPSARRRTWPRASSTPPAARRRTATPSPARPRPTRATSSRWSS